MIWIKTVGKVIAAISVVAILAFLAITFYLAFIVNFAPDSRPLGRIGCYLGVSGFGGLIVGVIIACIKESALARIRRRHVKGAMEVIGASVAIIGLVSTGLFSQAGMHQHTIAFFAVFVVGSFILLTGGFLAKYKAGEEVMVFQDDRGEYGRGQPWRGVVKGTRLSFVIITRDGINSEHSVPECHVEPVRYTERMTISPQEANGE